MSFLNSLTKNNPGTVQFRMFRSTLLLAGLVSTFGSAPAFAGSVLHYDDGKIVEASVPGSYWEATEFPAQEAAEFRLYRADHHATDVFYRIDLKFGLDLATSSFDVPSREVIPRPGRTLWQAHPVQNRTLEKEFLKAAEEFYGKIESRRPITKDAGGQFIVRSIESDLKEFEKRGVHTDRNSVLASLRASVVDGWKRILKLRYDVSLPAWAISIATHIDPVEPSVSKEGPAEARFDAFSLYPSLLYAEDPERFDEVLNEVSRGEKWDPIGSMLFEAHAEKRKVRLALLILITHNHATEWNLVRTVLATEKPSAAWAFSQKINSLYAQARSPYIAEEGMRTFNGCGGAAPVILPEKKAYHYLGAWALAERLDGELPFVPKVWREKLLRYATDSYINLTDSDDTRKAELRSYYDSAVAHRKTCFEHPIALGERIWAD